MIRQLAWNGALAAAVLLIVSLATSAPPTRPLQRFWTRHGSTIRWYVRSAPATFVYLGVLGITTWTLLGMPTELREAFIAAQSTNLRHLTENPVRVLVRSAFFVTRGELLAWIALFAMLLAPAERWLGSARTIAVFVTGHVLATGLAALDVWVHVTWLHAPASLWNVEDTGASYGFMALAALLVHRLRGWSRVLLGATLAAVVVYGAIGGTGFTARGHAAAVLVGLALFPITRTPGVRERVRGGRSILDLWRPSRADGPPAPLAADALAPA